MGSALFLGSWAVLMGPMIYGKPSPIPPYPNICTPAAVLVPSFSSCMLTIHLARHLLSQERLPFTATYFGSIALTLYFALGVSPSPTHNLNPSTPQTIKTILTPHASNSSAVRL